MPMYQGLGARVTFRDGAMRENEHSVSPWEAGEAELPGYKKTRASVIEAGKRDATVMANLHFWQVGEKTFEEAACTLIHALLAERNEYRAKVFDQTLKEKSELEAALIAADTFNIPMGVISNAPAIDEGKPVEIALTENPYHSSPVLARAKEQLGEEALFEAGFRNKSALEDYKKSLAWSYPPARTRTTEIHFDCLGLDLNEVKPSSDHGSAYYMAFAKAVTRAIGRQRHGGTIQILIPEKQALKLGLCSEFNAFFSAGPNADATLVLTGRNSQYGLPDIYRGVELVVIQDEKPDVTSSQAGSDEPLSTMVAKAADESLATCLPAFSPEEVKELLEAAEAEKRRFKDCARCKGRFCEDKLVVFATPYRHENLCETCYSAATISEPKPLGKSITNKGLKK